MHFNNYELLFREKQREFESQAASARLARLANERNSGVKRSLYPDIADVLQKVGSKFVAIYHSLYQINKNHISPKP